MGVTDAGLSGSQCLCERCGKYHDPAVVAANRGRCPRCGQVMRDNGFAELVTVVGGKSKLKEGILAKLAEKQRALNKKIALANGEGGSGDSKLLDELTGNAGLPKTRIFGSDDMEDRDPPDFAPPPDDEALIAELMDADADMRAADIWELDDDEDSDIEWDECGNPVVKKPADAAPDAQPDAGDPVSTDGPADGGPEDGEFDPGDALPDAASEFGLDEEVTGFEGFEDGFDGGFEGGDEMPSFESYDMDDIPEALRDKMHRNVSEGGTKRGVPTRDELKVLCSSYSSLSIRGFDRGPRPDFWTKYPQGKTVDGVKPHSGVIARLDNLVIEYPQNFEKARKMV